MKHMEKPLQLKLLGMLSVPLVFGTFCNLNQVLNVGQYRCHRMTVMAMTLLLIYVKLEQSNICIESVVHEVSSPAKINPLPLSFKIAAKLGKSKKICNIKIVISVLFNA